ncbi:MAG TPA: hypothetical protein PKZ88_07880, partial [Methanothermobacter sp.]|nr:hypothetical protein [Methanothermobacter sp.]
NIAITKKNYHMEKHPPTFKKSILNPLYKIFKFLRVLFYHYTLFTSFHYLAFPKRRVKVIWMENNKKEK